jgi:branched-subunit amino acid aminotransferase/4-amino-4-deoxychorismate lyase
MATEVFETLRTYDGAPALLGAHLARMGCADRGLEATVLERLRGVTGDVAIRIVGDAVELGPLPAESNDPVDVKLTEVPGYAYPVKSTDRALHDRLLEEAGTFDVLIVDDRTVVEGARTNVFLLTDDELVTPPLGRCLPGITRAALLEIAPALGLNVRQRPIAPAELFAADHVLLTNSLRGVRRVGTIDGSSVGGGGAELPERLQAALLAHYREQA